MVKIEWKDKIIELCKKKFKNLNELFTSSDESNKFYYDEQNQKYLICDLVLNTELGWFIFQIFTNNKYKHRVSSKNKFFYKTDTSTNVKEKSKTNWIEIFKISKINVDKFNKKFNVFILMAEQVDFRGASKGIYGATLGSLEPLLDKITAKR
ncbi:hypothetical protein [Spiroplasma clarkii]|uniref:Uncharacterized protein n=1 Tax=Spiroplasma clarkii TaxID=2139 RepID=A0A2K8KIX7_9MOLU|nr:hypothetical protein [Spiroplasma clarkii]ATX71192.1 hypothetical protein SCLAR_v1c08840 [Spiroplasma clarkii]